jgi:hypothetical protein
MADCSGKKNILKQRGWMRSVAVENQIDYDGLIELLTSNLSFYILDDLLEDNWILEVFLQPRSYT